MTLKAQLKNDSIYTFLNADEFAEDITYSPHGGTNKSIRAIINRQRISPAGEDGGRTLTNDVEIMVANDDTYGVAAVKKGFDKVIFPKTINGTEVTYVVVDVLGQDDGMWHLLVRA